MDKETASSVGAIIARKKMVFIHPAIGGEKSEQEICLQSFDDFTFDYVRKTVSEISNLVIIRIQTTVYFGFPGSNLYGCSSLPQGTKSSFRLRWTVNSYSRTGVLD